MAIFDVCAKDYGAEMSFAGNDGPAGRSEIAPYLEVAITVKDGENPVAVASEKVRGMFESTSDLGDWDGDAKLTPGVEEITGGSGSTLRFRVTPDPPATVGFRSRP